MRSEISQISLHDASAPAATGHLSFADLMRSGAIASVVVYHLYGYYGSSLPFNALGIVGVNALFVLSGFLLSAPYLKGILNGNGSLPPWRSFLARRFLRIYPLYAVVVVTTAAPFFFVRDHHGVSLLDVIAHLTFTHGFSPSFAQSAFNVPLWTMAVDAQFYCILPVAAFVLYRVGRDMNLDGRRKLIVGTILASVALSFVERALVYKYTSASYDADIAIVLARNAIGCAGSFALGVWLALTKLEDRRPSRVESLACCILAMACCAWLTVTGAQQSDHYGVQIAYDFVAAVAMAALLFGVGLGNFPGVKAFSGLPMVTWVASISYGVYCFHKPFSLLAIHLLTHRAKPESVSYGLAITAVTLGLTIPVAMLTYRFVEAPFLRMKKSLPTRFVRENKGDQGTPKLLA